MENLLKKKTNVDTPVSHLSTLQFISCVRVLSHSSADTPRSLLLTTFRLRFSGALSNICSSYLYCSLARSPATTAAAVVQCLTTDSPVTQLNFHSIRLCMLHTPIYTLCVSFLIPHHPFGSLLRCIENSVEQHPRVLQYLHWRQDFRRHKIQARHHSCHWTKHNRRETLCMLLLLFLRANKTSCSTDVVRTQMFFIFFQHV